MAYTEEYNTAKELLTEFGTKLILHKYIENEYDEESFTQKQTYKDYEGIGCKFNYTTEAIGTSNNIILAGDVYFLCQFDVDPTENDDQIILGKNTYSVISWEDLSPDGSIAILYKIQCRKVE